MEMAIFFALVILIMQSIIGVLLLLAIKQAIENNHDCDADWKAYHEEQGAKGE
jgi:hypothetical protein